MYDQQWSSQQNAEHQQVQPEPPPSDEQLQSDMYHSDHSDAPKDEPMRAQDSSGGGAGGNGGGGGGDAPADGLLAEILTGDDGFFDE